MSESKDEVTQFAEKLSKIVRATKGLPIEPDQWFSKLINVKDPDERSRFATYPLLARQVSLRLSVKMFGKKIAQGSEDWANSNASALIAYRGLGRKEWVEASKAVVGESQQINVGPMGRTQQEQTPKRRWWQRKQKEEIGSEFQNQ